jgi:hypothetical protein
MSVSFNDHLVVLDLLVASVNREIPKLRDELLRLLAPFVFAAFRVRLHTILPFSCRPKGLIIQ